MKKGSKRAECRTFGRNKLKGETRQMEVLTSVGYVQEEQLMQVLGLQTFSATVPHLLTDANNGKSFTIPNFPANCTIREMRIRSNLIAGQRRTWTVYVDNANGTLPADTSVLYRGTWDSSPVGEYAYIDNEIVYISADSGSVLTVTRGTKGTTPSYHDYSVPIKIANNGLRLILYKNSSKKLVDRTKILCGLMSWKGNTSAIALNDRLIKFSGPILNIDQYDTLYIIDGNNSERASVQDINNAVANVTYVNTIFVANPLLAHVTNIEVRKQMIYDMMTPYSGSTSLYGILFVDEKIDDVLYPTGIIVDIDLYTQS